MKYYGIYFIVFLFFLSFSESFAEINSENLNGKIAEIISIQAESQSLLIILNLHEILFLLSFTILLIFIFIILFQIYKLIKKYQRTTVPEKVSDQENSTYMNLFHKPEETVRGILMEDHEYDNIKEYDHNPPAWFNWLFSLTIIWAILYMLYFHVFMLGPDQYESYENEIAIAEAAAALRVIDIDFYSIEPLTEQTSINNGQQIFITNCAVCHGEDAKGGIGADLTDDEWIYGGQFGDIYKTIYNGIPEKGMIPWQGRLSKQELKEVSTYVYNLSPRATRN